MIAQFWRNNRYEISAVAAAAFILLNLWTIKTSDIQLTINEFFVRGVVLFIAVLVMMFNL